MKEAGDSSVLLQFFGFDAGVTRIKTFFDVVFLGRDSGDASGIQSLTSVEINGNRLTLGGGSFYSLDIRTIQKAKILSNKVIVFETKAGTYKVMKKI